MEKNCFPITNGPDDPKSLSDMGMCVGKHISISRNSPNKLLLTDGINNDIIIISMIKETIGVRVKLRKKTN